jgi:hypothetical protein
MDQQQRVFVAVDREYPDLAFIMVGALDSNGQPNNDAYLVESTAPVAANVVGSFIARKRGLEFITRHLAAGD